MACDHFPGPQTAPCNGLQSSIARLAASVRDGLEQARCLPDDRSEAADHQRGDTVIRIARVCAVAVCAAIGAVGSVQAADYPTRPVSWIVPYPPAGTTDVLARIVAQWLTEKMGQPFVVENKPGGGNNIGTEAVVNVAARRLHDAARQPGQRHQRDALQEPDVQLHPRHRAGGRPRAHAERDGGDQPRCR